MRGTGRKAAWHIGINVNGQGTGRATVQRYRYICYSDFCSDAPDAERGQGKTGNVKNHEFFQKIELFELNTKNMNYSELNELYLLSKEFFCIGAM